MSNSLSQKFNAIKLRLTELQQEDDKSAETIRTDLFLLVKITGEFDEYLEVINNISFIHKKLVFNMGHIEKIRTFNAARENLLQVIEHIRKEIDLGKLKPKLLPKPENISIPWILKNASPSLLSFVAILIVVVFCFGAIAEQKYNVGKNLAPWLLSPLEQIKTTLSGQIKTP